MEISKVVKIFGLSILEERLNTNLTDKELEEAKKIFRGVLSGIDKTAEFVNENELVEPITNTVRKVAKYVLFFSLAILIAASLALFFLASQDNFFGDLVVMLVIMMICRVVLAVCAVLIAISLFCIFCITKKLK